MNENRGHKDLLSFVYGLVPLGLSLSRKGLGLMQ